MTIKSLKTELLKKYNCIAHLSTWESFLESAYQLASENKLYTKAHLILELINEHNSDIDNNY